MSRLRHPILRFARGRLRRSAGGFVLVMRTAPRSAGLDLSRVKTDGLLVGRPHRAEYLDTAPAVSRWMSSIGGSKLVALDTEGASFHRFVDRIYLLQVSTRERTAVIDP